MRELNILLQYDAQSVEQIDTGDGGKAAYLGRTLSDMLQIFTFHAKSPHATPDDRYIIVCKNGAAYYDITRGGRSLLDSDDRYRLHLVRS